MSEQGAATVLITWEMGAGLGHLVRLGRIGDRLVSQGHRLVVASRDVEAAQPWFPTSPCIQSPHINRVSPPYPNAVTLAEVMDNIGLGESRSIQSLADAWHTLIDHLAPDAMVMDFSPGALLAAQARSCRKVLVDNGYSYAMPGAPMPSLRPWQPGYVEFQLGVERRVLGAVNEFVKDWGQRPLQYLSDLYGRVDATHLMTLPELDHTGYKSGMDYRGYLNRGGAEPAWPERPGRPDRVLAVLKPFKGIGRILARVAEAGFSVLAVVPGLDSRLHGPLPEHPGLTCQSGWIDMRKAAATADLVLCAGGDIVGIALLSGRPTAVVPFFEEQRLTAVRAVETGAARLLEPAAPGREWVQCLRELLEEPEYRRRARQLAERHEQLDPDEQLEAIIRTIV